MRTVLDARGFGWGSRVWMLVNAIPNMPQENKDTTLISLVQYLSAGPQTTARELLDIITQGVLTGEYVPTAYPEDLLPKPPVVNDPGYPEHDNPSNPLSDITEEEIDRHVREFDGVPTADDPFDGWTL